MTPLSLLRLQELDSLSRGPLVPQQSNGIRKMAWPSLCRGKAPRGLQNNSFMCYRRSVLQSLFHLPAFLRVLREHRPSSKLCDSHKCTCVSCGLHKLSETYWTSKTNDAVLTSGIRLFDKLVNTRARAPDSGSKFMWREWSRNWGFGDQQDAHEFLHWMLNEMHDPQLTKKIQVTSPKHRTFKAPEAKSNSDPLSFKAQLETLFQLSYRQKMVCRNCGVQRNLHSQQTCLGPLPLATSGKNNVRKDLSSYLRQFFGTEAIEIKCENKACSKYQRPNFKNKVIQKIVAAPEVLMIQLKCFGSKGKRTFKANPNINYGLWLDLNEHASKELLKEEGSLRYKLSSVIFHQGSSLEAGHYVGTFVGPTGIYSISDDIVQRSSVSALLPSTNINSKQTPYILTYIRTRAGADGSQTQRSELLTREKNHIIHDGLNPKAQHSINGETRNNHEVTAAVDTQNSIHRNNQFIVSNPQKPSNENPFKVPESRPPFNPQKPNGKNFSSREDKQSFSPQHRRDSSTHQTRRQKKKQKRRHLAR